MPTYEYKCLECDCRFEVFQQMTDEPISKCEECGGKVKRLIGTGAGFLFKGSGFYCTDYRSDSYTQAAKKDSAASTTSTSSEKSKKNDGKSADSKGADKKKSSTATSSQAKG